MTAPASSLHATVAAGSTSRRRHRTDIDGLRAVAVLGVLLSHAGFARFSGGWVGVDVFFVISGFLITGILVREHRDGTFSFRRFWMRRVRRIIPALVVVVLLCFPFAWWLMFPDYIQNFGQSAVATMASANNLLLALTSGYWDLESDFKPLIHTWSLGVEEQFYVVYPVLFAALLIAMRRRPRRIATALAVLAGMSLVLAEIGVRLHPSAAFYLPHYRAWELLVGALAAFVTPTGRRIEKAAPTVGLVAVLGAVLFFSPAIPSPSSWLLIPVVGTALVLAYGESDRTAHRLLSWRPMVVVGLISYSAYLIHQPVFAFVRLASVAELSPWLFGLLVLPVLGMAWVSWRFVEEPFRNPRRIRSAHVLAAVAPPIAVALVLGLVLHLHQGFPARTFPNLDASDDVYIGYNERVRDFTVGTPGASADPSVLVLGNSYGRDIANVLLEADDSLSNRMAYLDPGGHGRIPPHVLERIDAAIGPDTVVVLALENDGVDAATIRVRQLEDLDAAAVHVFGTKDFGWNLSPFGRVPVEERAGVRTDVSDDVVRLNDAHASALPHHIDVIRLLGEDGRTLPVFDRDGNPLSPDRRHLTRYGAQLLADRLVEHGVLAPGSGEVLRHPDAP